MFTKLNLLPMLLLKECKTKNKKCKLKLYNQINEVIKDVDYYAWYNSHVQFPYMKTIKIRSNSHLLQYAACIR